MPDEVREQARRKFKTISVTFDFLKKNQWEPEGIDGLHLNEEILWVACVSYAHDLRRLSDFHSITIPDDPKKACYLVKWITRTRPIQFQATPLGSKPTKMRLFANELLALRVALGMLKFSPNILSEDTFELLLYTLKYRHFDEGSFLPFFKVLKSIKDMQVKLPAKL
jgi:hypothetical protein